MQETKDVLKKVKKIEIKTRRLVDGLIQGAYHSIFKGRGIEFSEVREYMPGDDIRIIDWKVTSRMDHPYVKEFIEERDLTIYIVFDMSGSNDFGSIKAKKDTAIEIATSLMFAALRNNDRIGLCITTNDVEFFMKAKKGRKHILKMVHTLITFKPKKKQTDLHPPLRFLSKVVKKRSIMFILSDFYSPDFAQPLSILKNKHDIVAISLNDPREQFLPDIGYIEVEDEETGEQLLVNTSDETFRKKYSILMHERQKQLNTLFKKCKIDTVTIKSNEPFHIPLEKFFRMRRRKR